MSALLPVSDSTVRATPCLPSTATPTKSSSVMSAHVRVRAVARRARTVAPATKRASPVLGGLQVAVCLHSDSAEPVPVRVARLAFRERAALVSPEDPADYR